jgi:hypothetical protein
MLGYFSIVFAGAAKRTRHYWAPQADVQRCCRKDGKAAFDPCVGGKRSIGLLRRSSTQALAGLLIAQRLNGID